MRRMCTLILLLLSFSLFGSVVPKSEILGIIEVAPAKESNAALLLEAFSEEYTDSWLKKYTTGDELFPLLYTESLSKLLPMKNIVIGKESRNSISFYSLDNPIMISATFKDGRILALDINL